MAKGVRRDRAKESHWRRHVEAQGASGLAVRVYCQGEGLSESCFHWWRRELARRDREAGTGHRGKPPASGFAEIRVVDGLNAGAFSGDRDQPKDEAKPAPASARGVEIFLSSGRRLRVLRGFDEPTLMRVVALLEGASAC